MFLKFVEPLVSLLFVERLNDKEALCITGVQVFNSTQGYSNSFKWYGDFVSPV